MKRLKLVTKLNLCFVINLVLPMIIAAYFAISYINGKICSEAVKSIDSDSKISEIIYQSGISEISTLAGTYAQKNALTTLLFFDLGKKIGTDLALSARKNNIDMITVVDNDYNVLVRSHSPDKICKRISFGNDKKEQLSARKKYIDQAFFGISSAGTEIMTAKDLVEEGFSIQNLKADKSGNLLVITGAAPIYDRNESITGVIIIRRILNNNVEILQKISNTIHAHVAVFEHTNPSVSVCAENVPGNNDKLCPPLPQTLQNVLKLNNEIHEVDITNTGNITKYFPLRDFSENPIGVFMIQKSISPYLYTYNTAILIIISIFLVIFIHNFCMKQILVKNFLDPLKRLGEKFKSVDVEDKLQELKVSSQREIGTLTEAFNEMIYRLKESRALLKQNEDLLMSLLSSTNNGIHLIKDRRFVWCNRATRQIFGWTEDELIGRTTEILYPNYSEYLRFGEYIYERQHPDGIITFEYDNFKHKDGSSITCFFQGRALDENDSSKGYVFSITDITKLKKAEAHIRELNREMFRAQENERKRIALDLHDHVAQELSFLTMQCGRNKGKNNRNCEINNCKGCKTVLKKAVNTVRNIAYDLRPSNLDDFGIADSLKQLCMDYSESHKVTVNYKPFGMENLNVDSDTGIHFYRLVQEAMTNVVKHAQATDISVKLVYSYPKIILRICDNGKGFDVNTRMEEVLNDKRMGIRSMKERVKLLDGHMTLCSKPGIGTKIVIKVMYMENKNEN
ncbi:Two component system response regulator/histidine kinase, PAS domain-containing [Desulfonema limicola]|uniref:Two component system response regulator/histidine kinase, PAS domain-containing n=1 Tax=Desulfonema limicola TaxID=45656 RepID=A0A975B496_9BACT|nr:PAS domain S-box protein [Desulfonema limicola]QTA78517.1 Two component system response regulator/histidine kinase, PAS domain-containing [Desulfonema limicola]